MTTRHRRSREDVVRAAGRLFARRGYHGTSMRDLGDELGLLGSSLYSHVEGKQDLLVAVISEGADRFRTLADEVRAWEDRPVEQLRRMIVGHVRIVTDDPDVAQVVLDEARYLSPERRDRVVELRDEYEQVFRDILAAGVAAGEFRSDLDVPLAAIMVLSILNSVPRWYRPDRGNSPEELARGLLDVVFDGLR